MIDTSTLTPEERKVIEARREYQRQWRESHKDRVQLHNQRFFEKKATQNKENASR